MSMQKKRLSQRTFNLEAATILRQQRNFEMEESWLF